jgi:hypothetical protein
MISRGIPSLFVIHIALPRTAGPRNDATIVFVLLKQGA